MGRFLAVCAIVIAAAWCVYINYLASPISGGWGFSGTGPASDERVLHVQRVYPGSPADRAGIKPGDTLRALVSRGMDVSFPSVGQRTEFQVTRGKTQRTLTLTAAGVRTQRYPTDIILFACELVTLALALLLVLRRWNDSAARALTLYLVCQAITLTNGLEPGDVLRYYSPLQLLLIYLGYAGLIRFAATYPVQAPSSRFRRALALWAPAASVALGLLWFFNNIARDWFTFFLPLRTEYRYASLTLADVLPAVGLISGLVIATQAAERKRLAILLAFFLASITGPIVYSVILANSTINPPVMRPLLGTLIIMYAGFVYVIVRHRLFDIGFVLNRAAIYALITTILLPVFALLEWASERYLLGANRAAGAAVQFGLALLLFLAVRYLHAYVERFVDTTLFRERHENEVALRDFARQVLFITDPRTIGERSVQTICTRTAAAWSALYMRNETAGDYALGARCGEYPPPATVSENDAAVVAMRTSHAVVEHLKGSAFDDAFVLPLLARGHVTGFLVCGPKTTNEVYAPDERDALSQGARGVAAAFESLRLAELENENRQLRAQLAT